MYIYYILFCDGVCTVLFVRICDSHTHYCDVLITTLLHHHQNILISPFWRLRAVKIILPIAYPVLLVEAGVVSAHVGYPRALLVAHMENLAVVLHISVKTHSSVATVERERQILDVVYHALGPVSADGCRLGYCEGNC